MQPSSISTTFTSTVHSSHITTITSPAAAMTEAPQMRPRPAMQAADRLLGMSAATGSSSAAANDTLQLAAETGDTGAVEALLLAGASVDDADKAGFTALMMAAVFGHSDIIKALMNAGARVD